MPLVRRLAPLAAAGLGVWAGYRLERTVLRPRLAATRIDDPAPTPAPDGHLTIASGAADVATDVYEGDGPTIVLVHGWTMTRQAWHEQVAALAGRYRLVTYDQPGHGHSTAPVEFTIDAFGDGLAAVVERAAPSGPVVLVGHSLGGMTVLNAMRRHAGLAARVRSVVLASTAASVAPEVGLGVGMLQLARLERLVTRLLPFGDRAVQVSRRVYRASSDLSFLLVRSIGLASSAAPHHVDLTEQLFLDSAPEVVLGVMPRMLSLDEQEGVACLTVPTWVVVGERDRVVPPGYTRRIAAACPSAALVELPGVGHMTPLEAAPAFTAIIERAAKEAA